MSAADHDDEQAIEADSDAMERDAAGKPGRQIDLLRLVAEEEVGGRHRHQDEADGEQHLVERACAVEPPVERALENDADESPGRGKRPAG